MLRAKPERMTIPNPGGALEEALKVAYFKSFTEKTGIEILGAPYADTAKIKAMVENNAVDTDVIFTDATEAAILAKLGLLEPIDFSVVDKALFIPEAVHEHYLLADVAAYAMAWNTRRACLTTSVPRTGRSSSTPRRSQASAACGNSRPDARGGGDGRRPEPRQALPARP